MSKLPVVGNASVPAAGDGTPKLLDELRSIILESRQQVVRSVNAVQVQTYWQLGRHSVLRNMRLFYQAFPNRDALRHELGWTHRAWLIQLVPAVQDSKHWGSCHG